MDTQSNGPWTDERVIGILHDLAKEEELPEHILTGKITGDDTVETLGIDSIGAVALIDRLEAQVGLPLPDDFLNLEDNIASIVERLNELA